MSAEVWPKADKRNIHWALANFVEAPQEPTFATKG